MMKDTFFFLQHPGHRILLGSPWNWEYRAPQLALVVKNPPVNAGDIRGMGLIPGSEDPLEKEMATHFNIPAWKIHGQRSLEGYSPWGCRLGHN